MRSWRKKQRLWRRLAAGLTAFSLCSCFMGDILAQPASSDVDERREAAVQLARRGDYAAAIRIFEDELGATEPDAAEKIVYDYLAVLQWQGRDTSVVAIYESRYAAGAAELPVYLLRRIGDSYYRLGRYEQAESLYTAAKAGGDELSAAALERTELLLGRITPDSPNVSAQALQEYAVVLARRNDFAHALPILQRLAERPAASPQVLSDYMMVLVWANQPAAALNVYQTHFAASPELMTTYAQRMAGSLLEAEGRYEEARQLYVRLAASGTDSAVYLAQFNARQGLFAEAMDYYDAAVANDRYNYRPYLERANAWLSGGAYAGAAADFSTAKFLVVASDAKLRRDIDAQRATAFIRAGEFAEGRDVLAPYIKNQTATMLMQCDYIISLQGTVNYSQAIAVGEKLWPDKNVVPAYGLQALADCYLRKGKYDVAVKYHTIVLEQGTPQRRNSLLSRAHAYLRMGKYKESKADYAAAAREFPARKELIAGDGKSMFRLGHFHAGKEVFRALSALDAEAGSTYRQHFAFDLLINEMPREAYLEYRRLAEETTAKEQAYAGMVRAAIMYGDYRAAKAALHQLDFYDTGSVAAAEARKAWEERWLGTFSVGSRVFKNYQTRSYLYNDLSLENDLGNSWRFLLDGGYDTFREDSYNETLDITERPTAYLPSWGAGLRYMGRNYDIAAVGSWLNVGGDEWGYRLSGNYYFNDFTWLSYAQGRATTENLGGLRNDLLLTERSLTMNRRVGPRDLYTLGYVWNTYSDDNKARGFTGRFGHLSVREAQKEIEWYVYGSDVKWNFESDLYDSPSSRVGYGPGLRMRWIRPRIDYWELTTELALGYDAPDNTDFTPFVRLEKGWELGPNESFVIGGEYGWRSDRTNEVKKLNEGYHQFDIRYTVSW